MCPWTSLYSTLRLISRSHNSGMEWDLEDVFVLRCDGRELCFAGFVFFPLSSHSAQLCALGQPMALMGTWELTGRTTFTNTVLWITLNILRLNVCISFSSLKPPVLYTALNRLSDYLYATSCDVISALLDLPVSRQLIDDVYVSVNKKYWTIIIDFRLHFIWNKFYCTV